MLCCRIPVLPRQKQEKVAEHIKQTQRKSDELELVDIAAEYRELFGHAIEEKPVSRECIEQIAAKCSGSLSHDIIDDRQDRL